MNSGNRSGQVASFYITYFCGYCSTKVEKKTHGFQAANGCGILERPAATCRQPIGGGLLEPGPGGECKIVL